MEIRSIPAADAIDAFSRNFDLIKAACVRGTETPGYLLEQLNHNPAWLLIELYQDDKPAGVVILQCRENALHVRLLSGHFKKPWLADIIKWLSGFAAYLGLKSLTACGRKGWQRRLKPFGVVKQGDTYYKGVAKW
jgi:hypothetical protein